MKSGDSITINFKPLLALLALNTLWSFVFIPDAPFWIWFPVCFMTGCAIQDTWPIIVYEEHKG